MKQNIILGAIVIVLVGAIAGAYLYPKAPAPRAGNIAGSTYGNAQTAFVVMNLANAGANGTSSAVLNTDTGTRYVTGIRYACDAIASSKTAYTGAGLASWTLTIGTSSVANANTIGATATVLNAAVVPTSTVMQSAASSTSFLGTGGTASLWHSGEYMDFQFNATNTAACTVGVDYIGS